MISIEEKQALLIKRWKELNPTLNGLSREDLRAQVNSLKSAKPSLSSAIVPHKSSSEKTIPSLASAIWEASGRDLKSIVPPGVKNQSWYLLNLIGVIDWYGNVAVGRDKYFEGWWNVVPPTGCTISYFGPGAEGRAREMAKKITGYYL
jgi:hypothetical protein